MLKYFGVPDAERWAERYAAVKQEHLVKLMEAGEFTAYPDAIRFVLATKAAGIPIAAASSSKNADLLLRQVRLDATSPKRASPCSTCWTRTSPAATCRAASRIR